jgi:hypothetical protein
MSHTVVYLIRYTVFDDGSQHAEPLGRAAEPNSSEQVGRQRHRGVENMIQIPTGVDPDPPGPSRDSREFVRCPGGGRLQPLLATAALRKDRRG